MQRAQPLKDILIYCVGIRKQAAVQRLIELGATLLTSPKEQAIAQADFVVVANVWRQRGLKQAERAVMALAQAHQTPVIPVATFGAAAMTSMTVREIKQRFGMTLNPKTFRLEMVPQERTPTLGATLCGLGQSTPALGF